MSSTAFTAVGVVVVALLLNSGLHHVQEGHVGVYWRGGALLPTITRPGYHWKSPIDSFKNVQVTMQTDQVRDIPCGTSGGVVLYFDKIEVVNRLKEAYVYETIRNYTIDYDKTWIFDRIHHSINEFCSVHTLQEVYIDQFASLDESLAKSLATSAREWAPGIEIIAIRVTKPRIPESIRANYEQMEAEKTKLLIAEQSQNVVKEEAHTERKRAVIDARRQAEVARITAARNEAEKSSAAEMSAIENEVHLSREQAKTDAAYYKAAREAESNALLFTPAFLQLTKVQALAANANVVFGDDIPTSLLANVNGAAAAAAAATAGTSKSE